jgi:deoxycytidine triphosphate deaminase
MINQSQHLFAKDDDEAKLRFGVYRSKDPFPGIDPALLNSSDIYDYVAKTGMIHPFDPEKLKSASYAVPILGKLVYWDEKGEKQIMNIIQSDKVINPINTLIKKLGIKQDNQSKEFKLRKNSIAFVTLEPMFRLPDYIAIRFNLKIKHIYRGLLLGTGPLVDPGFTGRLSIPLHNLTNNDYTFSVEEDLIWMEFTKLSFNRRWGNSTIYNSRKGEYKEFRNPESDVEDYLRKAADNRPVRSSIPEVFRDAEKAAKDAATTLKVFQGIGLLSILGLSIALYSLFSQAFSLVREKDELVNTKNNQIDSLQKEISNIKKEIQSLKGRQQINILP